MDKIGPLMAGDDEMPIPQKPHGRLITDNYGNVQWLASPQPEPIDKVTKFIAAWILVPLLVILVVVLAYGQVTKHRTYYTCADGAEFNGPVRSGSCSWHGGVADIHVGR